MDIQNVLSELSKQLPAEGSVRELYICGGAALNLLGISSRQTADIDVLAPEIDQTLKTAADKVAVELGLEQGWLNNGPIDLLQNLHAEWKTGATLVFDSPKLKVFSLGRMDLLKSKVWAACDRLEDIPDVVAMTPTEQELDQVRDWVLECDASDIWPEIVNQCLEEIKRRLN